MAEKVANIAKNTSYFTVALILQKVVSFTYFILIARALGPDDLGKYYFAISFTTVFAILIDLGFAGVLTREIAKKQENAESLLGTVLGLKVPLAFVSFLVTVFVINALGYPALTKELVYLSAVCMILDSFTLTFFSTIRGFHNLLYESISSVIFQLIVLATGLYVLHVNGGLKMLFLALILASIFNFIYSLVLVAKKMKIRIRLIYKKELIRSIFGITLAFTLFAVFQRIYTYLDSVLLSMLAGDREVGLYQVAFKIIFALQFLPLAFVASLYPALSMYWSNNRSQLAITFERAVSYLIIISLPISIGIIALADKVVLIFKSGYSDAILPLQITMASIFFLFINFPIGSLLNACDKQNKNTINMGITMIASVILNIILIPRLQAVGASITVLATNALMFLLGIYWVPKVIKLNPKNILYTFGKSAVSAFLMALLIYSLKPYLNMFVIIAISGAAYFMTLFAMGAFKKEDIASIMQSFRKSSKAKA